MVGGVPDQAPRSWAPRPPPVSPAHPMSLPFAPCPATFPCRPSSTSFQPERRPSEQPYPFLSRFLSPPCPWAPRSPYCGFPAVVHGVHGGELPWAALSHGRRAAGGGPEGRGPDQREEVLLVHPTRGEAVTGGGEDDDDEEDERRGGEEVIALPALPPSKPSPDPPPSDAMPQNKTNKHA